MVLQPLDGSISDTSTARPIWRTQFLRQTAPSAAATPDPSAWKALIGDIYFHLHVTDDQVIVRRFYDSVAVDMKFTDGTVKSSTRGLTRRALSDVQAAAMGFEIEVDAVRICLNRDVALDVIGNGADPRVKRSSRSAWFREQIENDALIPMNVNRFQRGWLAQLAEAAAIGNLNPEGPFLALGDADPEFARQLKKALSVLVGTGPSATGDDGGDLVDADDQGRLYEALSGLLEDRQVVEALRGHVIGLAGEAECPEVVPWQYARLKATAGAAILEAIGRLNPQLDVESLIVDIDPGAQAVGGLPIGPDEIWISESVPGGVGTLEQFRRDYAEDPRRFWQLVSGSLEPKDYELIDTELQSLVSQGRGTPLGEAMDHIRDAYLRGNEPLLEAHVSFRRTMAEQGLRASHAVLSAISTRLLRPGATVETCELVDAILARWHELEELRGIDIDVRTIAYMESASRPASGIPLQAIQGSDQLEVRRSYYSVLLGLLWLRGGRARSISLEAPNRFATAPPTDRLLVTAALESRQVVVRVGDEDWMDSVAEALTVDGSVQLAASVRAPDELVAAVLSIQERGIDVGFLLLYPRLARMDRNSDDLMATLELRESLQ